MIRIKSILHSEKLEETLKKAKLNYTSEAFLRLAIIAGLVAAGAFCTFGLILMLKRSFPVYILLFVFMIVFLIVFQLVKSIPNFALQNKRASLESDLLYSARHLLLKLESGSSLVNSIESVSMLNTNSSLYFKELIYDISLGTPMEDAIENAAAKSPSAGYSRFLEEISTSLKTGADLNKTLRSTIEDITHQHLIQIQEYGKKLNPMSMFYMIFGTILPSLGTAMLVVVSSFLPGMIIIDRRILMGLAVGVLFAQVFFILAFKSLKAGGGRMSFFYAIGESLIPKKIRVKMKKYLQKAGIYDSQYGIYGMGFIVSIIITSLVYFFFFLNVLKSSHPVFIVLTSFLILTVTEFLLLILLGLLMWLYYEFIIFRRTIIIEEVLPDFLDEVSVNLRAGMSFDKSLWNSVEPEFGVLDREIEIVAKKVMTGEDTEEALKEFADKYNSTLLQESMDMIIIGLKSGGNISDLIDKIVLNVKSASYLKKELIASVMSYIIFISVTAIVISPILFALSFNLMQIIQSLGEKLTTTSSSSLPISIGYKTINPEDFVLFSKICVVVIAAISGMIIADLREGSIKAGMKYVLIFIPVAYFIYLGMLGVFTSIFGVLV